MTSAPLVASSPAALRRPPAALRSRALGGTAVQLVALLALLLYAAFDHGAVTVSAQARLNLVLAVLALPAAVGWLWRAELPRPSPLVIGAVSLTIAFCAWNAVTLLWSVAPESTWNEFNRTAGYVLALLIAIQLGASATRAPEQLATGFTAVASLVALYAIAQKLLPGLHVSGVFDLNQTGALPRLQQPLGYWNALALTMVLGAPPALAGAVDRRATPAKRTAAAVALALMVVVCGLTLSRGGVLALLVAFGLFLVWTPDRLRATVWLLVAGLAAAVPLGFGLLSTSITTADVSLHRRESAGIVLLVITLAAGALITLVAHALIRHEDRLEVAGGRRGGWARFLAWILPAVLIAAAVLALAVSSRGLTGTVSHAWNTFTTTHAAAPNNPSRLLSADSENRWVWWKEAAGAFSDRPLVGWGAGSFGVVHLLYRRDQLTVQQPHSLPLQWLAETGLVGIALAGSALLLLVLAARRTAVGRRAAGSGSAAAALLAAAVAMLLHSTYDWDWDIPAVTLPAIAFLGVLIGAGIDRSPVDDPTPTLDELPRHWVRSPALVLAALGAGTIAISAAVPSLAADHSSTATVTAATGSPGDLRSAAEQARLATSLDPVSDAGPRALAAVELSRGRRDLARRELLVALRREPTDGQAWAQLANVELALGRPDDARTAARRATELDPRGQFIASVAGTVQALSELRLASPFGSATGATSLPNGVTLGARSGSSRSPGGPALLPGTRSTR